MDTENVNEVNETEQITQRKNNLKTLIEKGYDPYIQLFEKKDNISDITNKYNSINEGDEGPFVQTAGRLIALREHGKATFGNLREEDHNIQVYFKKDSLENYDLLKFVDIGDILGITGKVFKTRKGELTIWAESFKVLSKCIIPLPEKFHGLKDVELKYRQRYLDMIVNNTTIKTFINRSKVISFIRDLLNKKGYYEVETPVFSQVAGGAAARPFITHHNALDMQLYLRIATELHLKRCIVGGMEKVYEIGRIFRNEGISTRHNPEFTTLELYESYGDYVTMMNITEEIISGAAKLITGSTIIKYQDKTIDLTAPFKRLTMKDAFREFGNIDINDLHNQKKALEIAKKLHIDTEDMTVAHLMDKIFEEVIEPHLEQPTFILDYPAEL